MSNTIALKNCVIYNSTIEEGPYTVKEFDENGNLVYNRTFSREVLNEVREKANYDIFISSLAINIFNEHNREFYIEFDSKEDMDNHNIKNAIVFHKKKMSYAPQDIDEKFGLSKGEFTLSHYYSIDASDMGCTDLKMVSEALGIPLYQYSDEDGEDHFLPLAA